MSSTKKNSVPVEPKSINDVFSWDIGTLRNYYTRFWPKRTPPKHKDSIRRALLEEFTERKLLTNAKTAYDDVPPQGSTPILPPSPQTPSNQPIPSISSIDDAVSQDKVAKLEAEVAAVTAEMMTLRSSLATVEGLLAELVAAKHDRETEREQTDRMHRRNNLRITKLKEGADPMADAKELFTAMGCSVQVVEARRMGRAPNSYAAKTAGDVPTTGTPSRPLIVTLATFSDKLDVLRNRKNLKDTPFKFISMDDDLTQQQMAIKHAAWPAYKEAKLAHKRTSWRAHQLFIDGVLHTPTLPMDK
jgi:hypothetical protein